MDKGQIAEWLYDGAIALCKGNREHARELLLKVVEIDETNEEAWLWLSGAVDDPEDQETALLNVLDINPNNTYAKRGLQMLRSQQSG